MNSIILKTTSKILLVLLLLFSLFLLFRGHDLPGGGFVGGLMAGGAWALYEMAQGTVIARHALRVDPRLLIGAGSVTAVASGLISIFFGWAPFKGIWTTLGSVKLGSPMLFDIGVYLIVMGATLTIIFAQEEA